MINLGLDPDEQATFHRALMKDHEIRITSRILTLDHEPVGELTGHVLSGQVDVDVTQAVTRTASVSLLDPHNDLGVVDTDSPESVGAMAGRLLQIWYGVLVRELGQWVDVPIFTGPITKSDRDGDVVSLAAAGKESLLLDACCTNLTWRKGRQKTAVLDNMLSFGGESFRAIPKRPDRMTSHLVLSGKEPIWTKAQSLAKSLTGGYVLAYDGRGYAELVDVRPNTVWTFRGDDGGSLITEPVITADTTAIKNLVVVTGGVPQGSKGRIVRTANAPANHPFSAKNLGRNGRSRYLREDVEDDAITTWQAAQNLANARLYDLLQASIDAQFEALVIPHLEPWDVVRVTTEHQTWSTQLQKFSIPLSTDGRMTVGRHWTRRTVNGYTPRRPRRLSVPKPKPKPKLKPKKSTAKKRTR